MGAEAIIDEEEPSRSRWPIALAVAISLVLAVAVSFVASLAASPAATLSPALAKFGPGPLGLLKGQSVDLRTGASPRLLTLAANALPVAPLSSEPFFAAALPGFHGTTDFGGLREAALLRETLRRDPRSPDARTFLLQNALARGDLREAFDQIAVLAQLNDPVFGKLMNGLAASVTTEAQARDVVAALKPHPELFLGFMQSLGRMPRDAAFVHALVDGLPPASLADRETRRLAIDELVSVNDFTAARRLAASGGGAPSALLNGPNFADTSVAPPFGWDLAVNTTGAAERNGGGLSVAYYGREPGQLVAQLLTLPPGAYVVSIDYVSDGGTPGAIGVTLTCAESRTVFAAVPLAARIGSRQNLKVPVTVPAQGCEAQWLRLSGLPTEDREDQAMRVFSINVARGS